MALAIHPLLAKEAEEKAAAQQEEAPVAEVAPEVPAEPVPDPTSEVSAPEESAPETVAEEVVQERRVTLDPARYYQEIARLEQEDPEFRNAIRTRLGRKAAQEYRPKMADLEARLAEREAELQRLRAGSLGEEEIKERLLNDPEFRRTYGVEPPNPQAIRERAALEVQRDSILESAEQYLSKDEIAPYVQAAMRGVFDHEFDANGRPVRPLSPNESMLRFSAALNQAIQAKVATPRATPTPPPPPKEVPPPVAEVVAAPAPVVEQPTANIALAQSTPDLTANNSTRQAGVMQLAEYQRMNPPDQIRMFPEGLAAAMASGKIVRGE